MLGEQDKPKFPGYHGYRSDQRLETRTYRGLMILVRRQIVHQPIPPLGLRTLNTLGVQILIGGREIRLFAVYRPHGTLSIAEVNTLLDSTLPTLAAGDWNAKHLSWNSARENQTGRNLFNDSELRGYTIVGPEAPTHYPYQSAFLPDVIDIAVHKRIEGSLTQEVLDYHTGSDHQPVLISIEESPARADPPPPRSKTDWEEYARHFEGTITSRPIQTAQDVEELACSISQQVRDAIDRATTSLPSGGRLKPLPANIRRMIEEKRQLRKLWQRCRCPQMKTRLNHLAEKVWLELDTERANDWESLLQECGEDWGATHRLCRQITKAPAPIRPLKHSDGTLRYRAEDRAELLADCLERQFKPNTETDQEHNNVVALHNEEYLAREPEAEEEPIIFTPGRVARALRKAKPRKAPGIDRITNTALRHFPQKAIAAATRLFNGIMRTGHFPRLWKTGLVITLPKPGKDTTKPESYRPITLLPTLSKVLERLLLGHLAHHITPRQEQFGFRAEHSTTLQLTRVLHHMAVNINKKEHTVAVFLDMEKAFDRVWHPGLIYKLATTKVPPRLVRIIASFLEGRSFRVRVDQTISTERPILAGVPQGSCLSPVLYSLYTDDIPVGDRTELALYADDAAYLTSSIRPDFAVKRLQKTLDLLPAWLGKWRLAANASKTLAILVSGPRIPPPSRQPPKLEFLGQTIPWSITVKYLGVTIDRGLTMAPHVENVINSTRSARALLRPVLKSSLPLRTKLGVYKGYIRPRLTYAAPSWYALVSETNRKRLRAQQNITLRTVVNAPMFVRNETILKGLHVESVDKFISRLATRMFARAEASDFQHIRELAPQHARPPDGKAYPRDLVSISEVEEDTDDNATPGQ
ncbi:hypothetical protein O0L34_g13456 [Tuta absoluta]|nr:hypothetical protein O0L34_g13456 [Tuta absoluta]